MSTLQKRIDRDIKDSCNNGIDIIRSENNKIGFNYECVLLGPNDSDYEGGIFRLNICFKNDYPFHAPTITFITKIY